MQNIFSLFFLISKIILITSSGCLKAMTYYNKYGVQRYLHLYTLKKWWILMWWPVMTVLQLRKNVNQNNFPFLYPILTIHVNAFIYRQLFVRRKEVYWLSGFVSDMIVISVSVKNYIWFWLWILKKIIVKKYFRKQFWNLEWKLNVGILYFCCFIFFLYLGTLGIRNISDVFFDMFSFKKWMLYCRINNR